MILIQRKRACQTARIQVYPPLNDLFDVIVPINVLFAQKREGRRENVALAKFFETLFASYFGSAHSCKS